MQIASMQKLTLLDYPGTVACTLFTKGCNFRCPFCHNAPLVLPEMADTALDEAVVLDFLQARRGILEGVAITGGEPLLHAELPAFLEKVKALGYKIKLDTNGSRPILLEQMVAAGLVDRVAMDIKNAPDQYAETVGLAQPDLSAVARSKEFLMSCGIPYEFRTTVVKGLHTLPGLVALATWIQGAAEYYLQTFKDSGNLINGKGLAPFSEQQMQAFAEAIRPYVPSVCVRGK